MSNTWKNQLCFGDNLDILRDYIPDESVDLIYLDPPFNSKANYNVLFKEADGSASSSQITAFEDTWHWDIHTEGVYRHIVEKGPKKLADLTEALRQFLGTNDMMAYLVMMAARLAELYRVLKHTGSIYLHCDPTASHYIKLLLDATFGVRCFLNEIVWERTLPHGNVRQMFGRSHDIIFFYSKSSKPTWNKQYGPHRQEYLDEFYRYVDPDTGRRYRLVSCINPNPNRPNLTYEWNGVTKVWKWTRNRMQEAHDKGILVYSKGGTPSYKNYLDEMKGTPMQDLWLGISPLMGSSGERLGYPTQKPEALLERIILASSNEDDIVLDPFCGCGTTIAVAERLKRRWIGIDITHLAIALMKYRLEDTFGKGLLPYEVIGEPRDTASAEALALNDRHEFQKWAVSLVEGMPLEKKGADRGIDGYIYFYDDNSGKAKRVMIEVKSGHVNSSIIRSLKGVVEREKAQIGLLITLAQPTREMVKEAASAGFYESEHFGMFPKVQILTIEELLEGKELKMPPRGADVTFKKAKKVKATKVQLGFDVEEG